MTFRTKSGEAWVVDEAHLKHWRKVYARLDVWAEVAKAALWIEVHPSRRKTPRGMLRFLVAWLNRADRGFATARPVVNLRDRRAEPWHYQHCPHVPKCGDYRNCCELKREEAAADMTWHRMTSTRPLTCGSCKAPIKKPTVGADVLYARVSTAGLIRCRACAEDLRGWCSWPSPPVVSDEHVPQIAPPNPTQPFAPLRRQVADYKAKQAKDAV